MAIEFARFFEKQPIVRHRVIGARARQNQSVVAAEGRDQDHHRHQRRANARKDDVGCRRRRQRFDVACCVGVGRKHPELLANHAVTGREVRARSQPDVKPAVAEDRTIAPAVVDATNARTKSGDGIVQRHRERRRASVRCRQFVAYDTQ